MFRSLKISPRAIHIVPALKKKQGHVTTTFSFEIYQAVIRNVRHRLVETIRHVKTFVNFISR